MTSMSGWSTPENFETLLSDQRRQTDELARRVRVPNSRQIMGPGLGPWAVRLFDWNDERTLYNGVFYSEVGSTNSPDVTKAFIGSNWATQDGRGVQEVVEFGTTQPVYRRSFSTPPGQTPVFSPWRGGLPMGVALNFNGAWLGTVPGPTDGTSFTCEAGILRGTATCTGYNAANSLIAVLLYIDGVAQNHMVMQPSLTTGAHMVLGSVAFATAVTAGEHHVYFRQVAGSSDFNDVGTFVATVTPI